MADDVKLLAGALIGAGALYYLTKKAAAPPTPPVPPGVTGKIISITPSETYLMADDVVQIAVTVQNTSATAQTFRVGVSIGRQNVVWYDKGHYVDGLGDYYIVALAPNEVKTVSRSMHVPSDARITDIYSTLRTADLAILDELLSADILTVTPVVEPAGIIQQVTPYKRSYAPGEEIRIDITIKNTTSITGTFKVGVSIGRQDVVWYDAGYYTDGKGDYATVVVDANSTGVVIRKMQMPNDARVQDIWVRLLSTDLLTVHDEMIKINVLEVTAVAYGADIQEYEFH